jgi:hypothetical protein
MLEESTDVSTLPPKFFLTLDIMMFNYILLNTSKATIGLSFYVHSEKKEVHV